MFVRTLIFYAAFWRIRRLKCKLLLFSSVRENQLNFIIYHSHGGSICYSFFQFQANDGRANSILLHYQCGRWNGTWGRQEIYIYESSSLKIDYDFNGFNGNKMITTRIIYPKDDNNMKTLSYGLNLSRVLCLVSCHFNRMMSLYL